MINNTMNQDLDKKVADQKPEPKPDPEPKTPNKKFCEIV